MEPKQNQENSLLSFLVEQDCKLNSYAFRTIALELKIATRVVKLESALIRIDCRYILDLQVIYS
jgi:hypothetical protein